METLLGFIGGILGGLLATAAALWVYLHGYVNTEHVFFRQRRAETIRALVSYRFCLQNSYDASEIEAAEFNRAINSVPFDFSQDKKVMKKYDAYLINVNDTDKLVELIMEMIGSEKIDKELMESHIRRSMAISARRGVVDKPPSPPSDGK